MVGTWTWKSNYTENVYRKFVSDDLYLSVVNGCDSARPYVAGTTNMTCSSVFTSLRHFKVNRPWRVITHRLYTHNVTHSSRDSNFESRVDGPTGIRFIWKSYHDLKLVKKNYFLWSVSYDNALLSRLRKYSMRASCDICGDTWSI